MEISLGGRGKSIRMTGLLRTWTYTESRVEMDMDGFVRLPVIALIECDCEARQGSDESSYKSLVLVLLKKNVNNLERTNERNVDNKRTTRPDQYENRIESGIGLS